MITFHDQIFFTKEHPLHEVVEHELQQFRKYQNLDFKLYKKERMAFLGTLSHSASSQSYLSLFRPLIGLFPGSFNPFHKGHYNVLQKAEKIFDKVIIAFGNNPEKGARQWEMPDTIRNRQIEQYNGLLTDFVSGLDEEVVVIRGLRNSTDFQYEQNQYRYIQELMPNIRIVNIFCDKEFEHISSSGIRTLEKFNRHQNYLLD